jgi:hypothetical protein
MKLRRLFVILILSFSLHLVFTACHKGESDNASLEPPSSPKPATSPLVGCAADLQFVRNGGYIYIYVFSRKDGKPFSPDDKEFLKKNAPQVVDWARGPGCEKATAGTNFNLEEGNLALLKKRFVVEDYSGK